MKPRAFSQQTHSVSEGTTLPVANGSEWYLKVLQPLLARVGDQASVVAELVLGPDLKRERMP